MQLADGNLEEAKDGFTDMIGSIGPFAKLGLLGLGFRNKYQQYDPVDVVIGGELSTFVPFSRVLNDVSRSLDPFQRKQENFKQAFMKLVPTTDKALQEKLHGKIRTEEVPIEGEVKGIPFVTGRRTTIDVQLENNKEDVLLGLLAGIYIHRIDPKAAEAYVIRAEKNKERREAKERKEARIGE